ncbi:MAG: FAD-binding oxidoreductase [Planctomycetes bacterium]|nr:FAD-binding oxidoreductase [Planctomycetota bacterium]
MSAPVAVTRGDLLRALERIAGPGAVSVAEGDLLRFSSDYTENPASRPAVVVRVTLADQVPPILRLAQAEGTPVTPVLAASNVGGLCIPTSGGIVLDLSPMNRILEVNEADRFMVIEPGVTWQQVRDYLDARHPGLRFGYSLSPPDTTVLGNCLLDGLTNLSLRWGSMSDWLTALEAVLPTGERVRTGAWAWSQPPACRGPVPGLEGLFINWQGATGVVVKAAVAVQHNPALRERCFYFGRSAAQTFRFINAVARADLCDDLAGLTWPLGKMLFGEARPTWRDPAEPAVMVFVDYSSDDDEVFAAKGRAVERIARRFRTADEPLEGPVSITNLLALEPRFIKFADWPMRLDFMVDHPGGGLTWVGTYGPTSRWPEAVPACSELMSARGFPPAVVTRAMRGGHFGVLRMVTLFNKRDPAEIDRVRTLNAEIADLAWSFGFIPYKTPRWVVDRYRHRVDPGFAALAERVKRALDPAGIMNPGRWFF